MTTTVAKPGKVVVSYYDNPDKPTPRTAFLFLRATDDGWTATVKDLKEGKVWRRSGTDLAEAYPTLKSYFDSEYDLSVKNGVECLDVILLYENNPKTRNKLLTMKQGHRPQSIGRVKWLTLKELDNWRKRFQRRTGIVHNQMVAQGWPVGEPWSWEWPSVLELPPPGDSVAGYKKKKRKKKKK